MSQQQDDEKTRRYHGAIKILAKTEEWPHFKEWLQMQMLAMVAQNNILITTEEQKAQHNGRVGMLNAFKLVSTVDEMIENAELWQREMEKRIKEAEEQLTKKEKR